MIPLWQIYYFQKRDTMMKKLFQVEEAIEQEKEEPPEKLDLAFKEGQTIKVFTFPYVILM